ncbi:LOW QUALITY PROTEIN: RNA 5'-monophosphate methyltransferase-like [Sphaerodactylus townsendi]|uniref:LOW QUALITY PROTEIN: RNA 5'-monophosphate methyltransferase-like n=1 Tax=Sphaerodactylus townsendi TaxID=933632 RepID=UPI002026DCFE|nr:LOW QUALITY PROTEIN: RNA 5'-monophosphate methyltransferase-like [Sphaerodactylus townsendi]
MAAPTSDFSQGVRDYGASWLPGGAAPYGNFPDYSRFHPPEGRVRLLPAGLLSRLFPHRHGGPLLGLDVGCNSGELSIALYRHLRDCGDNRDSPEGSVAWKDLNLLCCDIDRDLIERAKQKSPFSGCVSRHAAHIMDSETREPLLHSYLSKFGRSAFDICFCMSVTMWIHLNHGDSGLVTFLSCLASKCAYLLVEPQPWKCYRAAARRLRKLGRNDFDHFRSLTINGDMTEKITQILTKDCAMEFLCCFGSTGWDRSLLLFKSNR